MGQQSHPWNADCLSVVTILAVSQEPRKLKRLARRFGLLEEGSNPDTIETFRRLHEACHQDVELARAVTRELDDRFRSTLLQVRSMDLSGIKSLKMDWPMPLLWALSKDEREAVRLYGRYVVHALIWDALRSRSEGKEKESDLQKSIGLLQTQVRVQRNEMSSLRRELEKKGADVASLQKLLSVKECPREGVRSEDSCTGRHAREIRKLRHDLEKERKRTEELEEIVADSSLFLCEETGSERPIENGCEDPKTFLCEKGPALFQTGDACGEGEECCKECPLDGLRVALVGGISRMLPEYRRVVTRLGAEFLFHDGEVRNGSYKLKSVVCGADIIVFITSVNSHGALSVVQAVCKNRGKKFVALKETGAESLARTLRKCAA